jgi:ribosome-binding protein aMBF1 (putative translation factor)
MSLAKWTFRVLLCAGMARPRTKQPYNAVLPQRLRELRHKTGLTAAALGERVGVSDRQIYRYEWGTSRPPEHVLERLAKALGRRAAWLLGWS